MDLHTEPTPSAPTPAPARRRWPAALAAGALAISVGVAGVGLLDTDPTATLVGGLTGAADTPTIAVAADASTTEEVVLAAVAGSGTLSVAEVAATVSPSVASVEVTVTQQAGPFGQTATGTATGSAVILAADGYLLTNNHVVDGASDVTVTLADGSTWTATIVGTDPTSDLAVLHIDVDGLPAATFADDLPAVGEIAVAIGSPFGLDGSVTAGIISGLDRTLSDGTGTLTGLVQTDAAINPGNSGGALVDDQGRIIGINTAIYSESGANDGVGFAVPATTAVAVAEQLITSGEVTWPVLGVAGQDVDEGVAAAYDLSASSGALVTQVTPGSGAEQAGLLAGDIVVGIDGVDVAGMTDLAAAVRTHAIGEAVVLTVVRQDAEVTLTVTLGSS